MAMQLRLPGRVLDFPRRPLVMGIVNVNDDSFSGDGTLDIRAALALAGRHVASGADIIDVGAESARTNRAAIGVDEEIGRLVPFIEAFHAAAAGLLAADPLQVTPPLLSINTWRPQVVEAVLPLGVDILNDIGALPDDRNARLCAAHGTALLIMHSVGEPKIPHTGKRYGSVMDTLDRFFGEKIALSLAAGLPREALLLDPGIDFAKQRDDNLRIYRDLARLHRFGRPILLPVSRKTVIGEVLGIPNPAERDAGTVACIAAGVAAGAQIFRVHNVTAAARSLRILDPLTHPAADRPTAGPR